MEEINSWVVIQVVVCEKDKSKFVEENLNTQTQHVNNIVNVEKTYLQTAHMQVPLPTKSWKS